ncbi:MAG: DUF4421 family protein [Bacteroidota bacterium]
MKQLIQPITNKPFSGIIFLAAFLCIPFFPFCQPDSAVQVFRDKAIPYIDLGGNTTPFTFAFDDSLGKRTRLGYRNNVRAIFGVGFAYKWFSLRIAANLPKHLEPVTTSGKTTYRDIVLEFKVRRLFFDVGVHNYKGFYIKDAFAWDTTLNTSTPNLIFPRINTLSLSLNNWWFSNKNIDMSALKGKRAMYLEKQSSFFLKSMVNFQGVSNDGGPLIPEVKQNIGFPITAATTLSSLDLGVLPGFLYVNRFKTNWQYSAMLSAGPVFQSQFFYTGGLRKNTPGIAGRYDVRLYIGYNVPKWFLIFTSEFDNKSISFKELNYRQTIYIVKLVTGIRLG